MTTINSLDNDTEKISSMIFEKCLLNKIDENLSNENYCLLPTINNNEIYEKIRPLEKISTILKEDQAHGDDTYIQISKDQEKSFDLFSYENLEKETNISSISSSSNQFSLDIPIKISNISNESLKIDNENQMTKSYFISNCNQKEKQQLPIEECEYEIDLGNGWITKSISSYQTDDKQQQQQRSTSIISADSIQPITTFKIPFTNTLYKQDLYPKQEYLINTYDESNVLFNSYDYKQQRWTKISFRTITIFSIGILTIVFIIIVIFFVF